MTLRLAELDGVDVTLPGDDDEEASAGIEASLADVVEPAKATALEKLGDGERGLQIARGWLRSKMRSSSDDASQAPRARPDCNMSGP